MKVVIPRAIPGAGKSTYVKTNYPTATIASADHFFEKLGKYDRRLIGKAHDECRETFTKAVERGDAVVVVDNTNIKVRDFADYVKAARAKNYEVEIIRLECDPAIAAKRNTHNVPTEIVYRMARDLSESQLPADYPQEKIIRTD